MITMRENVRFLVTRRPTSAVSEETVSNPHAPTVSVKEWAFQICMRPFLPPFEITLIKLPPESATLHLILVTASFE